MNAQPLIGLGVFLALQSRASATTHDDAMTMIDPPGGYPAPVVRFARAIAAAEGFGIVGAIPTRQHNPGNLKTSSVPSIGADTQGHLIFATDADGWLALYRQIALIVSGRSRYYSLDMTLADMGARYAGDSAAWTANVARGLGVSPGATLREILS